MSTPRQVDSKCLRIREKNLVIDIATAEEIKVDWVTDPVRNVG